MATKKKQDKWVSVVISDTTVQEARPNKDPKTGKPLMHKIWDSRVPGFHLRVTPAGFKSFCVRFNKVGGKKVDITLGPATEWTVAKARARAQKLREMHDEGKDARAHVKDQRSAEDMKALVDLWREHYRGKLKPSSQKSYDSIIKCIIIPGIGTRLVKDLDTKSVLALHRKEAKENPIGANRMITVLSKLMNIAEAEGWRVGVKNPCYKFEKGEETPSDRVLTAAELARLEAAMNGLETAWAAEAEKADAERGVKGKKHAAVPTLDPIAADLIRFLALSALRTSEATKLRWKDIDLDKNTMRFDDHKTSKKMGPKVLPLNDPLREILDRRSKQKLSPLVFPGLKLGKADKDGKRHLGPIQGLRKMWLRILKVEGTKLDDVTPHDLRRTFASVCVELGYPTAIADTLLGHSLGKITDTYVRLSVDGILSTASQDTALWIAVAMRGEKPKNGEKVTPKAKAGTA
jgi:integrase